MTSKKNAWEASDFNELRELISFAEVVRALKDRETARLAHKKAYLKRSALINWAKEHIHPELN